MLKSIAAFIVIFSISFFSYGADTANIKVSITIPNIVGVDQSGDSVIQEESYSQEAENEVSVSQKEDVNQRGNRILVKTVVSK